MDNRNVNDQQLKYIEFLNRENEFRHHYYNEEMLQYEYLKAGNPSAIEEGQKMFSATTLGHLSDNPLRNIKFLFVASITLVTRFSIEGGMEEEHAYNASDLYIQKMDLCQSVDEVKTLHHEMFIYFTKQMMALPKKSVFSKQIILCIDYIYYHLHESIRVAELAEYSGLNANYLSTLFKKEVGIPISEYVIKKRIEAAENMLKYSKYTYADISSFLAYPSQSYFTKQFKQQTGMTPKEYRNHFFKISFSNKSD